MTAETSRSRAARAAAEARWRGGGLSPNQVEAVSRAILASWTARAGLVLSTPRVEADLPFDEVVQPRDGTWCANVQVKGIARSGLTVHRKYVGTPVTLVYVLLGAPDGGLHSRAATVFYVLDPATAWNLPTELGMQFDPASTTYRWPVIGTRLTERLQPFRAENPDQLAGLLAEHATLKLRD